MFVEYIIQQQQQQQRRTVEKKIWSKRFDLNGWTIVQTLDGTAKQRCRITQQKLQSDISLADRMQTNSKGVVTFTSRPKMAGIRVALRHTLRLCVDTSRRRRCVRCSENYMCGVKTMIARVDRICYVIYDGRNANMQSTLTHTYARAASVCL